MLLFIICHKDVCETFLIDQANKSINQSFKNDSLIPQTESQSELQFCLFASIRDAINISHEP